jgi:hypothetical protein
MAELFLPLRHLFEWVDAFPSSIALRESQYVWAWVTVAHVVSMCLFAGLIVMMDLRLLGIGHMRTPFSEVQRRLFPWQIFGMTMSAITGLILVYAQPMRFFANVFFWAKLVMMAIAGANALAFHYITYDSVSTWDSGGPPPAAARLAGAVSIIMFTGVILFGRLIPYNWFM